MGVTAAPRKGSEEVRERVVTLVRDLVDDPDDPMTVTGAGRRVGDQFSDSTAASHEGGAALNRDPQFGMSGRTSHCRGASNWRCGGTSPPASILGRQTRALLGVRTAVATPVRYRGAASAARVVWRESVGASVGTGADVSAPAESAGRSGTDWWDASSGHRRAGPRRLDVGEGRLSTEHKVRWSNLFGDQARPSGSDWRAPRCLPRTAPGHRGGQRATHATHRPVTDGVGNAFAMRRSGVRIPAAPPTATPSDQRKW